jgi:hypothetical protein
MTIAAFKNLTIPGLLGKAIFDGEAQRRYQSGESLRDLAETYKVSPKQVRDNLALAGVTIRAKGDHHKMKQAMKPAKTSAKVKVISSNILEQLLRSNVITQADIDALATLKTSKPACGRIKPIDAVKQIADIVKASGGKMSQRALGDIYGMSQSWAAKATK